VRKEVSAHLWSQLIQRKKGMQKFGKSGDLKNVLYTSIFQMSVPSLIYEFVEGETPLGEALCRWASKMLTNFKKKKKKKRERERERKAWLCNDHFAV